MFMETEKIPLKFRDAILPAVTKVTIMILKKNVSLLVSSEYLKHFGKRKKLHTICST
jgi:hypothetical protein